MQTQGRSISRLPRTTSTDGSCRAELPFAPRVPHSSPSFVVPDPSPKTLHVVSALPRFMSRQSCPALGAATGLTRQTGRARWRGVTFRLLAGQDGATALRAKSAGLIDRRFRSAADSVGRTAARTFGYFRLNAKDAVLSPGSITRL